MTMPSRGGTIIYHSDSSVSDEERRPILDSDSSDEERDIASYEKAVEALGYGQYHWWIMLVCGWANCCDSVEVTCLALVMTSVQCDFNITSQTQLGVLQAVIFIGMMIGGYFWGSLADSVGRRTIAVLSLLTNSAFGFLSAFVQSQTQFVLCRFASGVGVGGSLPVIWSYFVELQPKHYRGAAISVIAAFWALGQIIVAGAAWGIIPLGTVQIAGHPQPSWRIFLAIVTLISFTASMLFLTLPESPKYLLDKNRNTQAMAILRKIYSANTHQPPDTYPISSLQRSISSTTPPLTAVRGGRVSSYLRQFMGNFKEIFSHTRSLFKRSMLRVTLAMLIINFTLSFGFYGLSMWFPSLFTLAEQTESGAVCETKDNETGVAGTVNCSTIYNPDAFRDQFYTSCSALPTNLVTLLAMDRLGRKPIFIVGVALSAVASFCVYAVKNRAGVLAVSCVFSAVSTLCWNAIDALGAELFPTSLRCTAQGLNYVLSRLGAIFGNIAFGSLLQVASCGAPLILVSCMLALCTLVAFLVPETARRPLD